MMTTEHILDFLAGQLADTESGWSLGTFGAIAEFTRDAGEPASLEHTRESISVVTTRGGLRIAPCAGLRLIASESPTKEGWSHRVALCLPDDACAMSRRTELTEVGPDRGALRSEDRDGVLFDLGLGTLQVDACIRSRDPEVVTALRARAGRSIFAPDNDAMRIILRRIRTASLSAASAGPRCSSRSRRRAAKARTVRIPMSCPSSWPVGARTRRPSRCRRV